MFLAHPSVQCRAVLLLACKLGTTCFNSCSFCLAHSWQRCFVVVLSGAVAGLSVAFLGSHLEVSAVILLNPLFPPTSGIILCSTGVLYKIVLYCSYLLLLIFFFCSAQRGNKKEINKNQHLFAVSLYGENFEGINSWFSGDELLPRSVLCRIFRLKHLSQDLETHDSAGNQHGIKTHTLICFP